mgnify:CR=1 FL=1|jgi:hypothetical protein
MKILLNIKNENVMEKLLWFLEHLKIDGVEIIPEKQIIKDHFNYTDEYIEENWREIVSDALSSFDEDYYKSEQYKLDRGEYLMEKYK